MWIAGLMVAVAAPVTGAAAPMATMDHTTAPCPVPPSALPAALAGWSRMVPLAAGADAARASPVVPGGGVKVALLPTPEVRYPSRPGKSGDPASSGGLLTFEVPTTGRYRIALGAAAWIDVVRGGTPFVSVTHGHGPACSGIRKMVDFDLGPGRYLLQIAGSGTATLPLMIARLP